MPEKRKRGRPKGSRGKKKDWPELKNVTPKDLKAANKLVADSFMDAIASQLPESEMAEKAKGPTIEYINPVSPQTAVAIYNAEHPNQHTEYYEVPFPEGWDKMGKIDKLKWLTANKNK